MSSSNLCNLLFLSGLAAFAMPGCGPEPDDGETAATTAADGGGSTGGSTDPSGTTEPSGTTTATATSTSTSTTGTTAGTDGLCAALANLAVECDPEQYDYATELGTCNELLASLVEISPQCGASYEGVLTCITQLDCVAFNADISDACQDEFAKVEESCGLGSGTGGAGTDD